MTTNLDAFETREIDVSLIRETSDNPRSTFDIAKLAGLQESIKTYGLQQPLIVRVDLAASAADTGAQRYTLVAGERRLRAVKVLGWQTVPCRVYKEEVSDKEAAIATVVENVERENLSTYELARACETLSSKYGMAAEPIGTVVRRNKFYVNNLLRSYRGLSATILAAWRDESEFAKTDTLVKIVGRKTADPEGNPRPLTHEEQDEIWHRIVTKDVDPFLDGMNVMPPGKPPEAPTDAPEASEAPEPTPEGPVKVKADTKRAEEMIVSLTQFINAGGNDGKLALQCVRYILNYRETSPVKLPSKVGAGAPANAKDLNKAADAFLAAADKPFGADKAGLLKAPPRVRAEKARVVK